MAETLPPPLEDIEAMARAAWANVLSSFHQLAEGLLIRVQDFADDDVLDELEIEDPWELTGLYQGVSLTENPMADSPEIPVVFLYRLPILAEWVERGDVALEDLVAHVLVHEVGHHFGLSDEDMDAILDAAD